MNEKKELELDDYLVFIGCDIEAYKSVELIEQAQQKLAALYAERDALKAVAHAAEQLMDTFDEFGNFNYSSEYIDALIDALAKLDKVTK
jgi:hypothetical protein